MFNGEDVVFDEVGKPGKAQPDNKKSRTHGR
jgi:hypothetical protein